MNDSLEAYGRGLFKRVMWVGFMNVEIQPFFLLAIDK
jgi:hypothetical protein